MTTSKNSTKRKITQTPNSALNRRAVLVTVSNRAALIGRATS